ncbi:MAG: TSUP family transporter [Verrucomicrobia bacterium]|jgi:uncharacterized membrane protein YfcA|nr:TSUP family transporter [Verrucomicrobiota bacterium]
MTESILQLLPFFFVALLYASVGHGGASGYLAVMALFGVEAGILRPTALGLNVLVSTLGTVAFFKEGHFRRHLFWPLIIAAVPMAYLGGGVHVDEGLFRKILGLALCFALARLFLPQRETVPARIAPRWQLLLAGAVMGFLSGLIGVGGGIFLTPLVILMRWGNAKTAAAISAPFILLNSLAGLAGLQPEWADFHGNFPGLAVTVLAGGLIGSIWGSRYANLWQIRWALGGVLAVAVLKLFFA